MFKSLLFVSSLLAASCAQSVQFGSPAPWAKVKAGSKINVMIERPDFNSQATEIALAVGVRSCEPGPCFSPPDNLGEMIFHTGSYRPQYAPGGPPQQPPHQNFTVTLPVAGLPKGDAQLLLAHWSQLGAAKGTIFFETKALNVSIV